MKMNIFALKVNKSDVDMFRDTYNKLSESHSMQPELLLVKDGDVTKTFLIKGHSFTNLMLPNSGKDMVEVSLDIYNLLYNNNLITQIVELSPCFVKKVRYKNGMIFRINNLNNALVALEENQI